MRPEPSAKPAGGGFAFMVRALRHRNYRLFFSGQTVSLIGSWMTRIATSWLVYRLTHSALLLGLVGFAGQIPSFARQYAHLVDDITRAAREYVEDVRAGRFPEVSRPAATHQP